MILDIHTHHAAPQPEGIISVAPGQVGEGVTLFPQQLYSVGIHPWSLSEGEPTAEIWHTLEKEAALPQVVAIGETGIDLLKGGPLFRQLNVFKRHVELSERVGKPLIIHCVRAHDHIAQLRRELHPAQPWVIHGFRGKPSIARILLGAGLYLSFGPLFNAESLAMTPADHLFAETDESPVSITEVITALAAVCGVTPLEFANLLDSNAASILKLL